MTDSRVLSSDHDCFERRSRRRTAINRGAVIFFVGRAGVYPCHVRDAMNDGVGIRLNGLSILPSKFGFSADNFSTSRHCPLVWRDGDFFGAAFSGLV
ncbi:MAG: hypothetical protein J0H40_24125 [Rhizobiales bacterium]|nr:hypothetical protein [Hyphomicrobiales bacterium]